MGLDMAEIWASRLEGGGYVEGEQFIQGSHMVSGTRCPAWSDQLKKWSESRAAAPKS